MSLREGDPDSAVNGAYYATLAIGDCRPEGTGLASQSQGFG
jgi:hypothetical protein